MIVIRRNEKIQHKVKKVNNDYNDNNSGKKVEKNIVKRSYNPTNDFLHNNNNNKNQSY